MSKKPKLRFYITYNNESYCNKLKEFIESNNIGKVFISNTMTVLIANSRLEKKHIHRIIEKIYYEIEDANQRKKHY
jgi:hypothetical protein